MSERENRVEAQLSELWDLVEELGTLSERLRKAADNAVTVLRDPEYCEKEGP